MKFLIVILFLGFHVANADAQLVGGDLLKDNRKIISNIQSEISSPRYNGILLFNISVNNDGIVTGATIEEKGSTIISTPARIDAKRLLLSLVFEKGNRFPKYHSGIYKITYKRKK